MTREDILKSIIESYEKKYEEFVERWRDLERKSQMSLTASGIIMAVIFGFIRNFEDAVDGIEKWLFFSVVAVLLATIASCLWTVRIRVLKESPRGHVYAYTYNAVVMEHDSQSDGLKLNTLPKFDLTLPPKIDDDKVCLYLLEISKLWKESTSQMQAAAVSKARFVRWSHFGVLTSTTLLGIITLFRILEIY